MRRSEKEITNPEIIKSVFERSDICRLGLVDGDAAYIVPMNFGYDNGILYFHSAGEGKKFDLLKRDPVVSFEIDIDHKIGESSTACGWGASYLSVMGIGRVEFINDMEGKKSGLNIIMKKYSGKDNWTFPENMTKKTVIFKLVAEQISCKGSK